MIYKCPITGRHFDPLKVKRGLVRATKKRFNELLAESKSPDALKAAEAEEALVAAARTALELPPVDQRTGQGVEDADVLAALAQFTGWLKGKGETAQRGPSGAPCTDCPGDR